MKYYDSMGFESENGIWVRRVDVAELEAILALAERRDAFKLAAQVRVLKEALTEAIDWIGASPEGGFDEAIQRGWSGNLLLWTKGQAMTEETTQRDHHTRS